MFEKWLIKYLGLLKVAHVLFANAASCWGKIKSAAFLCPILFSLQIFRAGNEKQLIAHEACGISSHKVNPTPPLSYAVLSVLALQLVNKSLLSSDGKKDGSSLSLSFCNGVICNRCAF